MPMPVTINGSRGSYNTELSGRYGANTAQNVALLAQQEPDVVSDAVIELSPLNSNTEQLINNAIGYGREEIKHYDQNGDMALDRQEIANIFMGNTEIADQYLKAYDIADKNGQKSGSICDKENAAAMLLALNPTKLVTQTLRAFAGNKLGSAIYTAEQQQELQKHADFFDQTYPTELRSYTTPQTRDVQYFYLSKFPSFVNETVRGITSTLNIQERLNQLFDNQ